ncbi:hypothetical protein GYB57_06775 [bacterium]|nr:hypothetical protein [bacterium]
MSSICGFVNRKGEMVTKAELNTMLVELDHWGADKKGEWINSSVALGHLMLLNTPESKCEVLPFYDVESELSITSNARIDNRKHLAKAFDISNDEINTRADSWFILAAYKKWGIDCVNHLEGDFVFALWDESEQQLFCARDRIGIKPFFYCFYNEQFAFASEMKGLLSLSGIKDELNRQWIGDFLMNIKLDRHSTMYKNIIKLEPAHSLIFKDSEVKTYKYWELDTQSEIRLSSEGEYVEAFLEKFEDSIDKRIRSDWAICSELSGGVDSSSIVSICHKKLKSEQFHTLSDVMPKNLAKLNLSSIDDRKLIQDVVQYLGLKNNHYLTGEEKTYLESIERAATIQDEPPREFLNVFFDLMMDKAQSLNSRVILSGYGGDDVVSYFGYYFHEELLLQGKWKKLWKEIKWRSELNGTSPYGRLGGTINHALFDSSNSRNLRKGRFTKRILKDYHNKRIKTGIRDEFANELDMKGRFQYARQMGFAGSTVREKIGSRLTHPGMFPLRLEYGDISTGHNRIEYRYPLLDIPLIQFFTSIPSTEKIKNGESRYFFRNAIKGLVPDSVINYKDSKGNTSPSTTWRKFRDKEMIVDSLRSIGMNDAIQEFVNVEEYIRSIDLERRTKEFSNLKGQRVLLLHRKLQKLKGLN